MNEIYIEPPENTRWIMSHYDLPGYRSSARFQITKADGSREIITLNNRKWQVLHALMHFPIYCASPLRLSDSVFRLRKVNGVDIGTARFQDYDSDANTRFGIYFLIDKVRYLGEARLITCDDTSFEIAAWSIPESRLTAAAAIVLSVLWLRL